VDDLIKVMEAINLIAGFLSCRDIDRLSKDALKNKFGTSKADLLILCPRSSSCCETTSFKAFVGNPDSGCHNAIENGYFLKNC